MAVMGPWPIEQQADFELLRSPDETATDELAARREARDRIPGIDPQARVNAHHSEGLPEEPPLAWRNRQVLSKRLEWPAGTLETCERVERRFPDYSIWWHEASGYTATYTGTESIDRRAPIPVHGVDQSTLEDGIRAHAKYRAEHPDLYW